MLSGLRTILFETTLRWPPIEGSGVKKDAIRRLYNKMFDPGGYRYENLDLQSETPGLSTRHSGGGMSVCRFGPSAITIEEKKTFTTLEPFIEAVTTVLGGLNEEDVSLPFFLQQCRMQCLAQPTNVENSLVLLAARVARVYEDIQPFGRPPSHFGVRFRFAPVVLIASPEGVDLTSKEQNPSDSGIPQPVTPDTTQEQEEVGRRIEKKGFVTVRFETHTEDRSQVWMEVTAIYPETDTPLLLRDTGRIVDNIRDAHRFLCEGGKRFLDQFDTKSDNNETQPE